MRKKFDVHGKKRQFKRFYRLALVFNANNPSTILVIILWQFTVFPCKFDSPQVKWDLISTRINFVQKLRHKLPKQLRLVIRYASALAGIAHTPAETNQ